jgi:two-component system CAI-1 autoinducer sensor kinase/phosphatase CqsS
MDGNIPFQVIYILVFSGIISVVFFNNREKIENEKISTLRDFGGIIAHEMRTPLSTISLLCKLIDRELKKDDLDKQKINFNVKKISKEVSSILIYVDMIIFKLAKNPDLQGSMEKLIINECVLDAIAQYPFDRGEKELIVFEKNSDFTVMGKKNFIVHIMFNLIQNAIYQIKSVNKGKVIITLSEHDTCNILSFKDTACGVDSSIYSRLFSPVFSKKLSGMGMGLYFCRSAMEAMGGSIICNTVPKEFAEFVLTFPRADSSEISKRKRLIM